MAPVAALTLHPSAILRLRDHDEREDALAGFPGGREEGVGDLPLAIEVDVGRRRFGLDGERVYDYEPGQYLVASVDLPVTGHYSRASSAEPALGFGLVISRAVRWITDHFHEPFRVEDLARPCGMSGSAFHRNFNAVTTLSPIQFQKQIRLQQARLMLITGVDDVATIGYRVGYESASQFNREYRRQFGLSPGRDAERLRREAAPA